MEIILIIFAGISIYITSEVYALISEDMDGLAWWKQFIVIGMLLVAAIPHLILEFEIAVLDEFLPEGWDEKIL